MIGAGLVRNFAGQINTIKAAVLASLAGSSGSSLVGFIQAAAGSVARSLQTKLRESVSVADFGAVGDGVADDTAAIQSALAAARRVVFPPAPAFYKVTAPLAITIANQSLIGYGFPQLRQETANTHLFSASGVDGVEISGLWLFGAIGATSTQLCNTVHMGNGCSGWAIRGNVFERHSGCGVFGASAIECKVTDNRFRNATNTEFCGDIVFWFASSRNLVRGNACLSGCDTGVIIQTINDGDIADDNIVEANIVEGCTRYGIIVYNSRASKTGNARRNRISGNVVRNIAGSVLNPTTASHSYGAGIYLLSAEGVEVSGNTIDTVCVNTDSDTLTPAGIGVNGTSCAVVSGNVITNSKYHGIKVQDPLLQGDGSGAGAAYLPDGHIVIRGNSILKSGRNGVFVSNKHNVIIDANGMDQSGTNAVQVKKDSANYPAMSGVVCSGNALTRSALLGLDLESCTRPVITGNSVTGNGGDGLLVDATAAVVEGNSVSGNAVGIDVRSTATDTLLVGNVVSGNVGNGIIGGSEYREHGNLVSGNGTDYSGLGMVRALADGATPSVKHGRFFTLAGPTAVTNFLNGFLGQVIYVRATAGVTITHGNGAIRLTGSANFNMTAGDTVALMQIATGTWDEIGRMDR